MENKLIFYIHIKSHLPFIEDYICIVLNKSKNLHKRKMGGNPLKKEKEKEKENAQECIQE